MKVEFCYSDGRTREMQQEHAEVLRLLRRGTYATRMMQAGDDLETMDLAALRDLASRMGVAVHHRAGVDRVRSLIREARAL